MLALFLLTSNEHILDKVMVKNRGLNHLSYKDVSPVTLADLFIILQIVEVIITSVWMSVQDMTLFIILPSSNKCMAYLTLVPLL